MLQPNAEFTGERRPSMRDNACRIANSPGAHMDDSSALGHCNDSLGRRESGPTLRLAPPHTFIVYLKALRRR